MLLRISLIVAIIAALAAGTLSYLEVTDKVPALTKQRDDEKDAKNFALTELANTNRALVFTQAKLAQTEQDLADTRTERDNALASAEAQKKRADGLADKLAKVTQERDNAQNQLAAYQATGLTSEQVAKLDKTLRNAENEIAAINGENKLLQREKDRLQTRLNKYEGTNLVVTLPADLRGKILVVDPKWDFVVLNVGEEQGIKDDGELLVSREGKLVAKVIVRSMEKDRCIANIVPGWKIGEPIEGDEVTPAHPAPAI